MNIYYHIHIESISWAISGGATCVSLIASGTSSVTTISWRGKLEVLSPRGRRPGGASPRPSGPISVAAWRRKRRKSGSSAHILPPGS